MTMARLFAVTVDVTLYVVAEDAEAAEEWVENNTSEWSEAIDDNATVHARPVTRVPDGWWDALPWLADIEDPQERTCAEWVEAAKAEVTP
jgi:hypothetical protein